jgi:AAA domain/Primase C terminal 2 (PriCT-2)/RepB DNA-primase N-terminal domain
MPILRDPPHEHTVEFLKALDQNKRFTFQTFKEKGSTADVVARVTHSWREVQHEHDQGAGIYVTVNETDLTGRKSENIVRIRAVWQEDDNGYSGQIPLAPSIVVESSPGHFHRYWLVADNWPADEKGRKDFAAIMERLVESYGSDKNAKDISRVLRLPGFLNRKNGGSHPVRLVENTARRYTRTQLLEAFPPPIEREETEPSPSWKLFGDEDKRIRDALSCVCADDRDIWLQIGMALKVHFGESGRPMWDSWSARSNKYNKRDQDKTWKSFHRNGIGIGTLFYHAKQSGWQDRGHEHKKNQKGKSDGPTCDEKAAKPGKQLVVHSADLVDPEAINWFWRGRIARGKTTLIGGDPGLGKSQLSIFIAATMTVAGQWPCSEGSPLEKRSVIMLSAEDGVADTIVPRLMAAGADRQKVKIVTAVYVADGNGRRIFNLTHDLDVLEKLIIELGDVGLIIIDPVDAYIGGNIDSHKNAAVRAVLEPISELADRLGVAILALTHFSKQLGGKTIYRFIGSIAHIGAARVAFAVVADPEDKTRMLLLHAKNNLAPTQKGLAYRVEQHLVAEGIIGASINFEREYVTNTTADEVLAAEGGSEATAKDDVKEFLQVVLAGGRVKVKDIEAEARAACLMGENQQMRQSKPFRSASDELKIFKSREGFGPGAVHYWSLPQHAPSNTPDTIGAHHSNRAHMGNEGAHDMKPDDEDAHGEQSFHHMRPQGPYAPSLGEGAHGALGIGEGAHETGNGVCYEVAPSGEIFAVPAAAPSPATSPSAKSVTRPSSRGRTTISMTSMPNPSERKGGR